MLLRFQLGVQTLLPDGLRCYQRTKSYRHMTAEERETLSLGLAHGHRCERWPECGASSQHPEPRVGAQRYAGPSLSGLYGSDQAAIRARQPRRLRKLLDPWLWQYVQSHLTEGCSPEQIAGRLRRAYPDDMVKQLSTRPSMRRCMCCPAVPCAANCWRR